MLAGGNLDPTNPVPGIENPEAQQKAKDMGGSGEGARGTWCGKGSIGRGTGHAGHVWQGMDVL